MTRLSMGVVVLASALAPAAQGDFRLFAVTGTSEQAVGAVYDWGTVAAGQPVPVRFRMRNMGAAPAVLSYLEVRGVGFGPRNPLAVPLTLGPQNAVDFEVSFRADDFGTYSAALSSEGISVILTAKVQASVPLPLPRITINLEKLQSGQQGSVAVSFEAPAQRSGSGQLTLNFHPSPAGAMDAAIAFSSGQQTATFTFTPGDREGRFGDQAAALFQTGTTAGTLLFTAQIGSALDQQTVTIAPAIPQISVVQGTRSAGSLEIRITGFDNVRTAGPLSFLFFDGTGAAIAPGVIRADATDAFRQFYQASNEGGTFLLRAVFPVTGDASWVAQFEVNLSNSAGAAAAARTSF